MSGEEDIGIDTEMKENHWVSKTGSDDCITIVDMDRNIYEWWIFGTTVRNIHL